MNSNEKKERVPFEELASILHVDLDWCGDCRFRFPEDDACDGCGAEHGEGGSIEEYCRCDGKLKPCWNDPARPALKYFPWCADYHPDFKPCLLVEVLIKSRACPEIHDEERLRKEPPAPDAGGLDKFYFDMERKAGGTGENKMSNDNNNEKREKFNSEKFNTFIQKVIDGKITFEPPAPIAPNKKAPAPLMHPIPLIQHSQGGTGGSPVSQERDGDGKAGGLTFTSIISRVQNFGKNHLSYWGCALAGEVGELCNLIKKIERDDIPIDLEKIRLELADIFIYVAIMSRDVFKIDLEQAILDKLQIVKKRREP